LHAPVFGVKAGVTGYGVHYVDEPTGSRRVYEVAERPLVHGEVGVVAFAEKRQMRLIGLAALGACIPPLPRATLTTGQVPRRRCYSSPLAEDFEDAPVVVGVADRPAVGDGAGSDSPNPEA
jgi:hypothetical protein